MFTVTLVALLSAPAQAEQPPVQADVVIRGATIYDGSGKPGVVGDLAIKDDRIAAVGQFTVAGNPRVLDATGLILAPGFIDLHTHSDAPLTQRATSPNLNYVMQGVTTVVTGNCGSGPTDVAGYFRTMEKLGVGSNVVHQVPHNAVRLQIMGNANRDPTPNELRRMEELVDKGMRDGAWGLSTGLIYNPGTYSKTDELIALAKVAARHGGFYASHIRDESTAVLAALEEIIAIAHKAGLRVHVSHIKVSGRRAWGKAPDMIALIRGERSKGMKITADHYPYIAGSTSLAATVIPAKYREGSAKDLLARLNDPELGPRMRKDIEDKIEGRDGGKAIRIARFAAQPQWQGKDLATIADLEKKSLLDVVLDIMRKGGAQIVSFSMNEEEVRLFMREDWVATASDGSSQVRSSTVPHPRSYGCFPRKIGRYAVEDKIITLEQAIRSASGLPADILELPQRGYLKPGYFADFVVFDPKTYRDRATFDQPHQYATGVVYLFVNGRQVIADGKYNGTLAGRVLRHQSKAAANPTAGDAKETKSALETEPTGWIDLLDVDNWQLWKRVPLPPGSKLRPNSPWTFHRDTHTLHCDGVGLHEMFLFDNEYGDGVFHVEWRFKKIEGKKGYNSGVYVRNSPNGAIWHQAQVGSLNVGHLFGDTPVDGKVKRFRADSKVKQRGKEAGEWNIYEITCKGPIITLWINGAVTAEWTTCQVPRGYLGLEAEGFYIEFKNLRFKEMK